MIEENGALYVPLQTDNTEFIGAMNEAERRVKGFSDSTVEASSKINKALTGITGESVKMTNTFQGQARREVGLIADIEKELTILREKKRNAYTVEEIEKYNQKIQEAELNLKEYNEVGRKAVDTHNEQEKSQNRIVESLKRWGLGLLTITGAVKAFKEVIASSNAASQEFTFTIDGVKGALQQLSQALIPSTDQTGRVVTNMIEGFKNAKELSQAIDAYNDSLKSNEVLEAKEIERLKELETIWRNGSNDAELRKKNLDEWIEIKKEAARRELKIEQDLNDALVKSIQDRPNLKADAIKKEEIEKFTTLYATNSELMQKAEEYWAAQNKMSIDGQAVGFSQKQTEYYAKLRSEIQSLIPVGMEWNQVMVMAKLNASLNDKQIDSLRESFSRLYKAQAGESEVEAEVARWMGSLTNKAEKAASEINDLTNQIDTLKKQLETASESERKGIAEKIILLQKELDLRKQIVEQTIDAVQFHGFVPSEASATHLSVIPSVVPKVKPKQKTWQQQWEDQNQLQGTRIPEYTEAQKKRLKEMSDLEKERIENALVLTDAMYQLTNILEEQGIITGDTAKQFQSIANIAMSVMTDTKINDEGLYVLGNPLGVAVGLMQTLMANIQQSFPSVMEKEAARLQSKIDEINGLLEYQQRLIDQSDRKGGQKEARQEEIDLLKAKIAEYEASIQRSREIMDSWHRSTKAKKEAFENITALTEEVQNLKYELEDAEQAYNDFLTGGITENTIASAIIDGIEQGKIGADDFGLYMYDSIKQALQQAFMDQMMNSTLMKAYMNWFQQAMGEGGFTEAEAKQNAVYLEGMAKIWKDNYDAFMSGINSMPGMGETEASKALSGSIKGVTEQTASLVAGQMNAMRITQAEMSGMMQKQLFHLSEIAANTRYNKHLESIDNKLDALKSDSLRSQGL